MEKTSATTTMPSSQPGCRLIQKRVYNRRPTKTAAIPAHKIQATTASGPVVIVQECRECEDEAAKREGRQ